jgi:L-serine dehydratase
MAISVFDLFKIGIGPSSSHTVGPMRAARMFALGLQRDGLLGQVAALRTELYGSLGATGRGHGSDKAVLLGLEGETPEGVDPDQVASRLANIAANASLRLLGTHPVAFDPVQHLLFYRRKSLPYHANGMCFTAFAADGSEISSRTYYSVGGGFVVNKDATGTERLLPDETQLAYPFNSGAELLAHCARDGLSISELMLENEKAWRTEPEVRAGLLAIWRVMQQCVERGCAAEGELPGGLHLRRRAGELHRSLLANSPGNASDPLVALDWVNLYAMAVNEENAAGGRVVTAPTNGAGGSSPHRPMARPASFRLCCTTTAGSLPMPATTVSCDSCSLPARLACCTSKMRPSPAPKSAAKGRWGWPVRWPRQDWLKCSAQACGRSRMQRRSAWNTISA